MMSIYRNRSSQIVLLIFDDDDFDDDDEYFWLVIRKRIFDIDFYLNKNKNIVEIIGKIHIVVNLYAIFLLDSNFKYYLYCLIG